jgi:hypothetical protein
VVFKNIVIIGLGTLGGFTAEAISNLENTEKIVIIDHDIVEQKNLKNSIYRQIDIGTPKVEALKDILTSQNSNLEIWAFQTEYIEGITKLPKEDLVIDCRDFTYDRKSEIDVRFYISSRYLMADFRKNVTYKERRTGKYITTLTKNDLKLAATLISMMIDTVSIAALIEIQTVQKYELDYVKYFENNCYDIVYENVIGEDKFVNLPDKIVPILDMNKDKDLTVFLGSRSYPIAEKLIPINTLKSSRDLILTLTSIVSCQKDFNNFVVSVFNEGDNIYIELIPETGAA